MGLGQELLSKALLPCALKTTTLVCYKGWRLLQNCSLLKLTKAWFYFTIWCKTRVSWMFKFFLNFQHWGKTTHESMGRHYTVFMKHFFLSIVLIPFFFVGWHYSSGCFICENTRKTPVSMPYVTTGKLCVYNTIADYLPFIVCCPFYVRCLNLLLHG